MSTRERTLAILLIGFIALAANGLAGYFLLWSPMESARAEQRKLTDEVTKAEGEVAVVRRAAPKLAEARRRSLPADETRARQAYQDLLEGLLRKANAPAGFKITAKPTDAKGIPTLPNSKNPVYKRVVLEITIPKADLWVVHDFLTAYYKLNLLQQITAMNITREEDPQAARRAGTSSSSATAPRNDLKVVMTTEAIILDGAEERRTALPVPTAFAAVGGWRGYHAVALTPEAGRRLTPIQFAPVLSPKHRDYSLIVKRDIFHGPYPDVEPLRIGKINEVALKAGDKSPSVRIPLTGDLGVAGRVTLAAKADGKLIPATGLRVDQNARTVTVSPAQGESGTATVTVTATGANGQTATSTFRVSVAESAKSKEDISTDIRLVGVSTGSDGSATAYIRDNFNPHDYVIEVTGKTVRVEKYEYIVPTRRTLDKDYRDFESKVLHISDDNVSATDRTFKVIGVEPAGLVLLDVKPPKKVAAEPIKVDVKGPQPGKFGPGKFTPMGGPAKAPAAATPPVSTPLAAAVGGAAAAGAPTGPPVYRWPAGQPLSKLVPVPADEARKILQKVEQSGPVGAVAQGQ
jgi:hypothetical protein